MAFDGNGRIEALKEVTNPLKPFEVEVEVYEFNEQDFKTVEDSIHEIRQSNKLE